jgi:hypothetical protein
MVFLMDENKHIEVRKESLPSIVPQVSPEAIVASGVGNYLSLIRPQWQAKNLIQRVERLLRVDPSSACQRIFNASLHDLREKIVIAGLDIAIEAQKTYKLPPINDEEDILEHYNPSKIIELAHRMGLLTRPEYRRICRVYDIRKDLEHEDDEYEATLADCIYTFETCVNVILANDPVKIIKLTEIKSIVEEPNVVSIEQAIVDDYRAAPYPRQTEIFQFLISVALDPKYPDIVRQNSFNALATLSEHTSQHSILEVATAFMEKRLGRRTPTPAEMRVANVSGIVPYLRKASVWEFFRQFYKRMADVGYEWTEHAKHGELLRDFKEIGGLRYCPEDLKLQFLEWLILCYIGEKGGYGEYGRGRRVFYSNSGAPLAYEIIEDDKSLTSEILSDIRKKSSSISGACRDQFVERRFEELLDIYR